MPKVDSKFPPGVVSSTETYMDDWGIFVAGQPGVGKTTLSLTASKKAPKEFPPKKKVTLDDVFYIGCDRNHSVALQAAGIETFGINLRDLMKRPKKGQNKKYIPDFLNASAYVLAVTEQMVEKHGFETVVLDTASQYNSLNCGYWAHKDRHPGNEIQYWGSVSRTERSFFPTLLTLPCNVLVLCHLQQLLDLPTKTGGSTASKKAKVMSSNEQARYIPAISGQKGLRDYIDNMDAVVVLKQQSLRGNTKWVIDTADPEFTGKGRFNHLLERYEPANIMELVKKVRKGR